MKIVVPGISEVLVFKNGIVKVVKTFTLSAHSKCVLISKPPYALRGSFWVNLTSSSSSPPDDGLENCRIVSVRLVSYEPPPKLGTVPCRSWTEIVSANLDRTLEVVVKRIEQQITMIGKFVESGPSFCRFEGSSEGEDGGNRVFVIPFSDIVSIQVEKEKQDEEESVSETGNDLLIRRSETLSEAKRRVESERGTFVAIDYHIDSDCTATLSYLTKDMRWEPSYELHLDLREKLAVLKMQATVVIEGADAGEHHLMLREYPDSDDETSDDEEEEGESGVKGKLGHLLTDVDGSVLIKTLYLAGGNPQLHAQDQPESLLEKGRTLFPRASIVPRYTNALDDALSDCSSESEPEIQVQAPAGGAPVDAAGVDYVLYKLENVSVASRMSLPVFVEKRLPFSEIFMVDLVVAETPLPVRHVARVRNKTVIPWTSAPVITSSSDQLLVGQSVLRFTPPGRNVDVELDASLSIRIHYRTTVKSRRKLRQRREKPTRATLQEITLEGVAQIVNTRQEPVVIIASVAFEGKLLESSIEPASKTERVMSGRFAETISTKACIRVEVEARSEETLTLSFVKTAVVRDL